MKLSTRARYALRMMLDVARNADADGPVSLTRVSARTEISRAYLEQLALALRAAGLLRGVSGRRGGYRLATPPGEITVGQVLEASIGPVRLVDCLEDPALCRRSDSCESRLVYQLINDRVDEVLRSYTLADLLDPSWVRDFQAGDTPRSEDGGQPSCCERASAPSRAEEETPG
jgi:Rrf2 family protein